MIYIVDMVYTVNMVYTADMVYTAVRSEGAEGAEGTKEGEVADGTDLAATNILSYGYNTMGLGYMSLWGFGAKCVSGEGDTP